MKQLIFDPKKGVLKLQAEHADDLYTLSQLIEKDDIVEGRTMRKIKLDRGGGEERKAAVVTKPVFLSISVTERDFTGETLRVSGTVTEGKEEIPRGAHHTFTIEAHDSLSIMKPTWPTYMLTKVKEACSGTPPSILIVILDRDEAYFALMRRTTYEIIAHLTSEPQKKAIEQAEKNFHETVARQIEQYDQRHAFEAIILASPAFFKDETAKILSTAARKKVILCTSSSVGKNGIDEVLKRKEAQSALAKVRMGREMDAVERLLAEIARHGEGGKAAYGMDSCAKAADAGAIATLLVTEGLITTTRSKGTFNKVSVIMKQAELTGGEVIIISSEHDGGKRLDGLGGIGAILRYTMYQTN